MDKVYIIRYKERLLRAYLSRTEAEKYYSYVSKSLEGAEKFIKETNSYSYKDKANLQLIAIPVEQEGKPHPLNMRLMNAHAGGGDPAIHYELGEVK